LAEMLVFTTASAASTLAEDDEICCELVLRAKRVASILEDEFESESDDVMLVVTDAFMEFSEASTLDEESERLFELPLIVESAASTLDDDDDRLTEEA